MAGWMDTAFTVGIVIGSLAWVRNRIVTIVAEVEALKVFREQMQARSNEEITNNRQDFHRVFMAIEALKTESSDSRTEMAKSLGRLEGKVDMINKDGK